MLSYSLGATQFVPIFLVAVSRISIIFSNTRINLLWHSMVTGRTLTVTAILSVYQRWESCYNRGVLPIRRETVKRHCSQSLGWNWCSSIARPMVAESHLMFLIQSSLWPVLMVISLLHLNPFHRNYVDVKQCLTRYQNRRNSSQSDSFIQCYNYPATILSCQLVGRKITNIDDRI